ncbi:hypothetical protein PVK06_030221 [Gossypium arboreum]|uniref:RNase H type-1 domain-containing protein n=1 Tax=Gossypium arboreum TaxID=29729 RepID=A0ABR0NQ13_GOSAR|nr:hypothetical protein PVK06_030221 [Gossypium arboreum]
MTAGKFSIRESYKYICCTSTLDQLKDDETIWKMKVPQRVKTFLWMPVRNKILTNAEHVRRGQIIVDGGDWKALFSIVTWFIWKNRNEFIFTSASRSSHELITLTFAWTKSCGYSTKLTQLVCSFRTDKKWQRLKVGWVKINVDGSVMTNYTKAAVGGVVLDWNGKWLIGFNMVTGMDKIFRIEARAIVEGMKLAWLNGYKQVEINCDNAMLTETICNGFASISNIEEVRLIHEWCKKD